MGVGEQGPIRIKYTRTGFLLAKWCKQVRNTDVKREARLVSAVGRI